MTLAPPVYRNKYQQKNMDSHADGILKLLLLDACTLDAEVCKLITNSSFHLDQQLEWLPLYGVAIK